MTDFTLATRATFKPRFGGVNTTQWELRVFTGDRSIHAKTVVEFNANDWQAWAENALSSIGSFPSTWLMVRTGGWETRLSQIRR